MKLTLAALGISLALVGCATGPSQAGRHAAHHPPGDAAGPASGSSAPGHMDAMMKSMQEMHDKLQAAKTPEERAALMNEHMKLMHDGMAMMGRMRGGKGGMGMGGMPISPEAMGRRMDMMEMMMQMMVDREALKQPHAAH
jgi:hypothetical protein